VFNGKTWAQINSNTDTYIEDLEITISDVDASTNTVSMTVAVVEHESGTRYSDTYGIKGANGTLISKEGNSVVISGDTYTLGADYSATAHKASLKLNSANSDNDSQIDINEGSNIKFKKETNGSLTLSAENTVVEEVNGGWGSGSSDTSSEKEGMYVEVKDTDGSTKTAQLDPVVRVGVDATYYQSVKFINGRANLPVYSKTEIDKKFVGLDAMSYKGTAGEGGSSSTLTTSTLSNGDTYLCAGNFTQIINGITYKAYKGDLVICRGTEGTDGYITAASLQLDVVPSGDDAKQDTTYVVIPSDNGFQIVDKGGSSVGGMTVNGDNTYITVTDTPNASTGTNTLTVSHNKITSAETEATVSAGQAKSQPLNTTFAVPVVESIKRDAAGHVTEVKVRNYNLKNTNGHIGDTTTYSTTLETGKVIISSAVSFFTSDNDDAGTARGAFSIESQSLKIGAQGASVTLELEWGTF
jgi:hypothetical protein